MSHNIIQVVTGENGRKKMKCEISQCSKIQGTAIVLIKKNVLNILHDFFDKLTGKKVSLQLISAINCDPEDGQRGKIGRPAYLEKRNTTMSTPLKEGEVQFQITFDWEEEIGVPGAFTVRNDHHDEFYLKTLTLEHVPGHGSIHFDCNSWVYPAKFYKKDRVFFSNMTYLPYKTPMPLRKYREEELEILRGDGKGELQEADRVYDYAYYNDLGDQKHARPVLGGSTDHPYPRRVKGRGPVDSVNELAWSSDEEFARELLAGVNPVSIRCLEAIEKNKLFILDYHDVLMPYLRLINEETSTKIYASRTLLFLKEDGTLKPLAIELSLPHPEGDQFGAAAKCAASVYKLLHPHFRDTLYINALARQVLINAEGVLEATVFPGKYSMEMSSAIYKDWIFTDQALPEDLKKRGMAIEDENSPNGLRLMIEDYPFAVDGLEIWSAIKKLVKQYCSFYYKTNDMVRQDSELQSWWKEIQEKGHGDKKAINFGQYPYGGYLPNRPTISRRLMPEKGSAEYKELETNFEEAFFKTITAKPQALLGISLVEILSMHSPDEEYLGQRTPGWTSDTEPLQAFKKFQETLEGIGKRIRTGT
ncbi:hypothetical protein GH714_023028 [Hevea brasiliensis]|uniref:Lipoxygenase domain-containing protein n=1 Tax=Hevea brasiliensis TaxID=3981 RepID=A0A6A6M306_HEVBR|nr:hypothetical protein GH714_023028 [Hevea brasiliensis]